MKALSNIRLWLLRKLGGDAWLIDDIKHRYRVERDPTTVPASRLNLMRHVLDGYTVTNNDPGIGSISWSGLHIVYAGTDYTIDAGNTDKKYVWWDKSVSTTVLQKTDTLPTLTDEDILIFLNKGGIHATVPITTVVDGSVIVAESILTGAIAADQITSDLIAANTIVAGNIAAGTITAVEIAALTITAGVIKADAIETSKINNLAVETAKIDDEATHTGGEYIRVADLVLTTSYQDICTLTITSDGSLVELGIILIIHNDSIFAKEVSVAWKNNTTGYVTVWTTYNIPAATTQEFPLAAVNKPAVGSNEYLAQAKATSSINPPHAHIGSILTVKEWKGK